MKYDDAAIVRKDKWFKNIISSNHADFDEASENNNGIDEEENLYASTYRNISLGVVKRTSRRVDTNDVHSAADNPTPAQFIDIPESEVDKKGGQGASNDGSVNRAPSASPTADFYAPSTPVPKVVTAAPTPGQFIDIPESEEDKKGGEGGSEGGSMSRAPSASPTADFYAPSTPVPKVVTAAPTPGQFIDIPESEEDKKGGQGGSEGGSMSRAPSASPTADFYAPSTPVPKVVTAAPTPVQFIDIPESEEDKKGGQGGSEGGSMSRAPSASPTADFYAPSTPVPKVVTAAPHAQCSSSTFPNQRRTRRVDRADLKVVP